MIYELVFGKKKNQKNEKGRRQNAPENFELETNLLCTNGIPLIIKRFVVVRVFVGILWVLWKGGNRF